jgi:CDP-diacylglycerol--glycerol-3-phosphate 3-phosphatidyltransferase
MTMARKHRRPEQLLASLFNLPNQLSLLRLLLAVVLFVMIDLGHFWTAFVLFVVASSTDWLDGYFARKYGMVTTLGRMLDPFVDKVIVCGTFVYLVAIPELTVIPWGIRAWMVVVIVGREMLVTALRSFIEERGADFSANMLGKVKMVLQCFAAGTALFYLAYHPGTVRPDWLWWVLVLSTWSAVLLTAYSGIIYVWVAHKLLKG